MISRLFQGVMVLCALGFSLNLQASISLPVEGGKTVELYNKSYALVIGVSDYQYWPDLPGVAIDVDEVGLTLESHGFKVISLLNPTRVTFDSAMREFISTHGQDPENRLLVYYAGHGHTLRTRRGRELGYIIPSDAPLPKDGVGPFKAKAISMLEVEIFAKQMEAKHVLFTFDSCFSGSLFEITRAIPDSISQKTAEPVRQFITAGSSEQTVPDKSVFRSQFISGLDGDADLNKDGFITGTELAQYIESSVTNYTHRAQTPQYGKIRDPILDKGDFIFLSPKIEITISVPGKESAGRAVDPAAIELSYWNTINASKDPVAYQAYIDEYPDGKFTKLAKLLISQSSKQSEENRVLELQHAEEERKRAELNQARSDEFKRQQELFKQQQLENEQTMAAFLAEQNSLSKKRREEEARIQGLLEQQKLALKKQQALPKSNQQVAMAAPAGVVTAHPRKLAVVLRGEIKYKWDLDETQFTNYLGETYKSLSETLLPAGSNVSVIKESSNNRDIAYNDVKESKRICREQSVDGIVIGFVEVLTDTTWPSYSITYVNCGTGEKISKIYPLDTHINNKYQFERSIESGYKDFWRTYIAYDMK